jgi:ribosomal protein S18 acetylase RimI-like enzyme
VRRVSETDWSALRAVRLRSLADSPDAFGSTLEREAAFSDTDWQEWARDSEAGSAETCILAWLEEAPVGIVGAYTKDGHAHLIAMWVAAEARRQGLGRALVEAIVSWSAESGAQTIRLDVMVGNVEARRLHESFGFAPTGRTKQYEDRPHITTLELERLA